MFRRSPDVRDDLIRQLMKQNADLMDRFQELVGQIHMHQVQRAEVETQVVAAKLHVSEEEDDLRFMFERGEIDKNEYEDMLGELGFQNTEIQLVN